MGSDAAVVVRPSAWGLSVRPGVGKGGSAGTEMLSTLTVVLLAWPDLGDLV